MIIVIVMITILVRVFLQVKVNIPNILVLFPQLPLKCLC